MDTVSQMRVLVRIVERGTFSGAALTLDTSPGAISRAISELEARLRTRLFNRSTRKVSLTPAGELYLQRCKQILADIEQAEEEASDAQKRPMGKLRVHSFTGIGQYYVLPAIKEYRSRYPEVKVQLAMSQQIPALFEGSADVAVVATSSALPDSDLVSHWLGSSFSVLCASPDYLREHGFPKGPKAIGSHECIIHHSPAFPAYEWLIESERGAESMKVSGCVELNTAESVALAVRAGMGIGVLPVYSALDGLADGSLVRVLPRFTLQKMDIYVLHPSRKFTDARIKTWIELLKQFMPTVTARDCLAMEDYGVPPGSAI